MFFKILYNYFTYFLLLIILLSIHFLKQFSKNFKENLVLLYYLKKEKVQIISNTVATGYNELSIPEGLV
jgi:hypothetical protein